MKQLTVLSFVCMLAFCANNSYAQTEKSIEQLQKDAANNDAVAMYDLGHIYEMGYDIDQDYAKSFYWYKKAAENNYIRAMKGVSRFYLTGRATEKDPEKGFYWWRKFVESNDESVMKNDQFYLATFYYEGTGTTVDREKAEYWCKKAAEGEFGMRDAQTYLGTIYYNGVHGTPDFKKSFDWYKMAAEQYDVTAMGFLSEAYTKGEGTTVDLEKAAYWSKQIEKSKITEPSEKFFTSFFNGDYNDPKCDSIYRKITRESKILDREKQEVEAAFDDGNAMVVEVNRLNDEMQTYNPRLLSNGNLSLYNGFNLKGYLKVRDQWLLKKRVLETYKENTENRQSEYNKKVALNNARRDEYKECYKNSQKKPAN